MVFLVLKHFLDFEEWFSLVFLGFFWMFLDGFFVFLSVSLFFFVFNVLVFFNRRSPIQTAGGLPEGLVLGRDATTATSHQPLGRQSLAWLFVDRFWATFGFTRREFKDFLRFVWFRFFWANPSF